MPVNVEVLPGEPIVLVTVAGRPNVDDKPRMYQQIAAVADQWGEVYAVYDMTRLNIPWSTMLAAMTQTVQHVPGSSSDERVTTIIVGTSEMVKTSAEALGKDIWGGLDIKVVDSVNEALGYARVELANGG